jgi:hypothetical protein
LPQLLLLIGPKIRKTQRVLWSPHGGGAARTESETRKGRARRGGNSDSNETTGAKPTDEVKVVVLQQVNSGAGQEVDGLKAVEVESGRRNRDRAAGTSKKV